MNVLSLFDGMSCGQIALDQLNIPVENYFAAEIDKFAIKVATANYPDMIQLGDVKDVWVSNDINTKEKGILHEDKLHKIDLLIGGSPCQGFSFAGKQLNFDDPRSKLFWEYVRLLKALKPKYFLLENVRMKKESMDVITEALGVDPVAINSNLVSAQNRYRLYWTNIPMDGLPEDKGIKLKDILENGITDREKSHCLDAHYFKGGNLKTYFEKHRRQLVFSDDGMCHVGDAGISDKYSYINRVYHPDGKGPSLVASTGGHLQPKVLEVAGMSDTKGWDQERKVYDPEGISPTLTGQRASNVPKINNDEKTWRKLTPLECERLQTVPEGYTNHVSNTQRYRMLGNGWTVDVVKHIMKGLK